LRGIYAYGYEKPSEIQQIVIEPFLEGKNLAVRTQAGTGKTSSYVIAALEKINSKVAECQALILVPTRELTAAICNV
jgi:translation initiation factor 4A